MPIVEDFLINLAAGFTQTLLMALGKRVLGDPQQRALKRAYQAGFEAMLRTAGSGLSQAELAVVGDVIGRFLGQPAVATALLDLGLVGAPLDVSALAARWNDASGPADLVNIRFDFGWGLLSFQQSLTTALINEASHPDSPLANQVVVTRLVALQGQVGQILDLLQAGPPVTPSAGAPTPTAPAPIGSTEPPPAAPPPAVPATLTAGRQPSAADAQPAAAALYHSCFISYASKDQAFADRLYADLRAAGVTCWYAPEDMAIGDRIRKTIYAAIGRLDKLLIILSRNSIASEWVEGEVERAFERERRQKETILFPIRLDDGVMDTDEAWAGDIRRTRHIGDFTRWNEAEAYDHALRRLLRDLEIGCKKQPTPSKPPSGSVFASALYTLRAPIGDFTGREDDVRVLVDHLSRDRGTAAITGIRGMGGIGKTELALVVAERLRERYPDAGLMFELQPGDVPLTPEAVLASVIRSFQPEAKLPEGLAELQGIYRAALGGKRGVLLLDNVAEPEQVRPLLPPPQGWAALVTSRSRFTLPGGKLHDLELLPLNDAVALLGRLLADGGRDQETGDRGQEAGLRELAERCGRLPLALRVAAGYLTTYANWTLADYLIALEQALLKYLVVPGEPPVQAVLGVSIDRLRERDTVLAGRWEQLAVFPTAFDRAAAAAVWGELGNVPARGLGSLVRRVWRRLAQGALRDPAEDMCAWPELTALTEEETQRELSALVQGSLLEYDAGSGTYTLHDLLRAYALATASEGPSTGSGQGLDGARLRHAWHYLGLGRAADALYRQGGAGGVTGLRQFEGAWPHLAAAWVAMREQADAAAQRWVYLFPDAVAYVLSLRVKPQERIPLWRVAAEAAAALGDRRREGIYLGYLGEAYFSLGDVGQAIELFGQALAIARKNRDRRGCGNALLNLGNVYTHQGGLRRAIELYEQALAIRRETREASLEWSAEWIEDRHGEGSALGSLGNAHRDLGEAQRAIEFYEQALAIRREIGDRCEEGADLTNLGLAYHDLGDERRAIECYKQSLAISRELRRRESEGGDLTNLALAYNALGEAQRAIGYYEQALAISREIGERGHEGTLLGDLGIAYHNLGETRQAIEYYEQALTIAREIGDRHKAWIRAWNLGLAYKKEGRYSEAAALMQITMDYEHEIGHPNAEEDARRLEDQG